MTHLKIALIAFILGLVSLVGINVFDDMEWEGVATVCAVILTCCGIIFVISIIAWIWAL